ncbi:hypothetical protein SLA2020_461800 [Shorea laevis]
MSWLLFVYLIIGTMFSPCGLRDSLTLWQQVCLKNWPLGISLYKDEINGGYMNVYYLLIPQWGTVWLCCGVGSS